MKNITYNSFSKSLLGASSIYIVSNIIEALLTFALLPILTSNLSKTDFGVLSIYLVFTKFFIPLIHFNTHVKISVDYFRVNKLSFKNQVSSLYLIPVVNSLFSILIIVLFKDITKELFDIELFYLLSIPVFVLFQYFPLVLLSINQSEKRPGSYSLFKICNTIINFVLAVFFILFLKVGWFGQIIGYGIGYLIFTIVAVYLLFKKGYLKFNPKLSDLSEGYRYGTPLLFYALSGIAMSMGDRLVLQYLTGYEDVAIYTVAYQIGTVIIVISTGVTKSLAPDTFKKLSNSNLSSISQVKRNIYMLMIVLTIVSIVYLFIINMMFDYFIDSSYRSALIYIPVLSIGLIFQGFYMLKSNILFYYKKNNFLGSIAFVSAFINVFLNFLLIPRFGIMGACFTTLLTYFIMWTSVWFISWNLLSPKN